MRRVASVRAVAPMQRFRGLAFLTSRSSFELPPNPTRRHGATRRAWRARAPRKSPAVRQGVQGSFEALFKALAIALRGRSPLQCGSGLLRLVAVVEGEQWLPGRAEMIGTE